MRAARCHQRRTPSETPSLWVDCVPNVSGLPQTAVLSGESGLPRPRGCPCTGGRSVPVCPAASQGTGAQLSHCDGPRAFLGAHLSGGGGAGSPFARPLSWRGSSHRLCAGHDPSLRRASPWGPHPGGASVPRPPASTSRLDISGCSQAGLGRGWCVCGARAVSQSGKPWAKGGWTAEGRRACLKRQQVLPASPHQPARLQSAPAGTRGRHPHNWGALWNTGSSSPFRAARWSV